MKEINKDDLETLNFFINILEDQKDINIIETVNDHFWELD